jgi:hypothetical protein
MDNANIHNILSVNIPPYREDKDYTWTAFPYKNTGNVYIINIIPLVPMGEVLLDINTLHKQ